MRVFATIKSPTSEPVEVAYTKPESSAVTAIAAVTGLLDMQISDTSMPESMRTTLVSIRIEVEA